MLDGKQREEIVDRRAQGESLRTIADGMGISKTTVLAHVRDLSVDIKNARSLEKDAMLERLKARSTARLETKLLMMSKLEEEILRRDLSNVPLDKIFNAWRTLEEKIAHEANIRISEMRDIEPLEQLHSYAVARVTECSWELE